jgi:hypothetical protein
MDGRCGVGPRAHGLGALKEEASACRESSPREGRAARVAASRAASALAVPSGDARRRSGCCRSRHLVLYVLVAAEADSGYGSHGH